MPGGHPYRSPGRVDEPAPAGDDAPVADLDIAPMLALALLASVARVLWAAHVDDFDVETSYALGTALLCSALLWPVADQFARRLRRPRRPR